MKLISSKWTYFIKKILPVLFLGILLIQVGGSFLNKTAWKSPIFMAAFIFVIAVVFFVTYFITWELADQVFDDGDYLVFKRGYKAERISLTNIVNVKYATNAKQVPITLYLVTPCEFGALVSFIPVIPYSLNPFAKNPIAEDLIARVGRAHKQA